MFEDGEFEPSDFDVLHLVHAHSYFMVLQLRLARDLLPLGFDVKPFHAALDAIYKIAQERFDNLGGENSTNNFERISQVVLNHHKIFSYINAFAIGLIRAMESDEYQVYIPLYEEMEVILATILTYPDVVKLRVSEILGKLRSYNGNTAGIYPFFDVHADWPANTYKKNHLDEKIKIMIEEFSYADSRITELSVSIDQNDILNEIAKDPKISLFVIMDQAMLIADLTEREKFLADNLPFILAEFDVDLKAENACSTHLQVIIEEGEDVGRDSKTEAEPVSAPYSHSDEKERDDESILDNINFEYSEKLIFTLEKKIKKLNQEKERASSESDQENRNEKVDSLSGAIELYEYHIICCKKFLKDMENCGAMFVEVENKLRQIYENALLMHVTENHIFINYFLHEQIQRIKLSMPLPETGDKSLVERKRYAALCVLLSDVKRSLDNSNHVTEAISLLLDEVIYSTHINLDKDFPDQFALNQSLKEVFYSMSDLKDSIDKSMSRAWYKASYDKVEGDILTFIASHPAENSPELFQFLEMLRDNINSTDNIYMLDRNNQFFATNYYALGGEILSTIMKGLTAYNNDSRSEYSNRLMIWSQAISQYGIFNSHKISGKMLAIADLLSETVEKHSRFRIS